jgi:signal peptidase II
VTRAGAAARAIGLTAAVLGADQGTKALIRAGLERGERDPIFPGVALVNVRNRGVAFGLLEGGGAILIAFAVVALAALTVFFVLNAERPLAWLPMGLLAGGAAGNLIDRTVEGSVTDFIDLPAWPAFNLADVAIVAGVATLLLVMEGPGRGPDPDPG